MRCRLCNNELNTLNNCKAHIFPAGLLRLMSKNQYGNLLLVGTDRNRKSRIPIGSYDTEILCRDCDNYLGKFDDYAIKFVEMNSHTRHATDTGWLLTGVDHKQLKLFCISYLWRCSITQRTEFDGISLGTIHEEKLRELIIKGELGEPSEYTTAFSRFSSGHEVGGILFPAKTKLNGLTYYEGYLPGLYKFWIKVDSRQDKKMEKISLGMSEALFIHDRGDFDQSTEKKIMVRAAKNSK